MHPVTWELMNRAANKTTRQVALRWGAQMPFWYVSEYPKSGGTWLSHMLAMYLDVPFPGRSVMPLGISCVVHNHWPYDPRLRPGLYLIRDGRDVLVSLYFHRMKRIIDQQDRLPVLRQLTKAVYQRTLPTPLDPQDIRRNLPRFIDLEMRRRTKPNWAQHVRQWRPAFGTGIVPVTYEDLLADTQKAMEACLTELLSEPIDTAWLATCVDRFRFERVTGRQPGSEDRASFFRKGVAGDWRNHFSREAAEVFDRWTEDLLVELGYEADRSWVTEL